MRDMDPASLQKARDQLVQAAHDHVHWHDNLIRSIVCQLPCDPVDLQPDAHRVCRFGRWYYEEAPDELRRQPGFAPIEAEHQHLHRLAARLLRDSTGGGPVTQAAYDELIAIGERLQLQLSTLRHEVASALRNRDVLTGAYVRGEILPALREWRELARRHVQHSCIVFMDLDHLKEINDSFGHAAGDQVLAGVVRFTMEHLRPYDKVFRYGGDEFLISLPGVDIEAGQKVIEHIRAGLARTPMLTAETGQAIVATASFGLALLEPDLSVEESIDRADKALLKAKTAGRNRSLGWDPTITTGVLPKHVFDEHLAG